MVYKVVSRLSLIVILLTMSYQVFADQICMVKGGGSLDNILNQFTAITLSWQNEINPLAKKIFYILFGMEFMWQLTVKKVFSGDIEKLWVFFFTRTVLCFFFAKYLVNIALYKDIISYFSILGSRLGGFSLNFDNTNLNTLGPSAILSNFSCIADMIHTATDQTGTISFISVKITLAIIQVLFFLTLIFIAFYLIRIILQAYLIVYIGFIFAGFAGSSWTFNYWQRYLSAVISVGAKFFLVCLIMGVLNAQMGHWATQMTNVIKTGDLGTLIGVLLNAFGTSIIMALAIWQLPEWFSGVLTGQIGANLSNPLERMYGNILKFGGGMQMINNSSKSNSGMPIVADIHKNVLDNLKATKPLENVGNQLNDAASSDINPFKRSK